MLCEHGNIAPCVECDIEPLKAENEALRRDMSALVEALRDADEYLSANNLSSIGSGSILHRQMRAALAARRKQGGGHV